METESSYKSLVASVISTQCGVWHQYIDLLSRDYRSQVFPIPTTHSSNVTIATALELIKYSLSDATLRDAMIATVINAARGNKLEISLLGSVLLFPWLLRHNNPMPEESDLFIISAISSVGADNQVRANLLATYFSIGISNDQERSQRSILLCLHIISTHCPSADGVVSTARCVLSESDVLTKALITHALKHIMDFLLPITSGIREMLPPDH